MNNPSSLLQILNSHKDAAWETWPASLRKPLRAISSNGNGRANSCTFGPSREYYYRKTAADGSSEFVKG